MIWPGLIVLLAITLVLVLVARRLALRRGRDPFAWGLATALFPPVLLLLLLLPSVQSRAQAG